VSIRAALIQNDNVYVENNLYYQKNLTRPGPFEVLYLLLREKENRLYPEDLVKDLPEIPNHHPLQSEWIVRKKSLDLLVRYLVGKNAIKRILEVGCGNGWLSNRLAQKLPAEICGVDVNEFELKQAAALFAGQRLSFVYASAWKPVFPLAAFDVIILASSVQYFPDLKNLIERLLEFNTLDGEIHILDSPFYHSVQESEAAQKRSRDYFNTLGFPHMAGYYFHHTFNTVVDFNVSMMYNPTSLASRFRKKIMRSPLSPFPWLRIKRK